MKFEIWAYTPTLDYAVMSKYCTGCRQWAKKDKTSQEYLQWKETHSCDINFEGSSGAMEHHGTTMLFNQSLDYDLRYKYLIADGDCKAHSLLQDQPYGSSCIVEKKDCISHIQKRMVSALRELVSRHRGQKLADGKMIGGAGRLTGTLMDTL